MRRWGLLPVVVVTAAVLILTMVDAVLSSCGSEVAARVGRVEVQTWPGCPTKLESLDCVAILFDISAVGMQASERWSAVPERDAARLMRTSGGPRDQPLVGWPGQAVQGKATRSHLETVAISCASAIL